MDKIETIRAFLKVVETGGFTPAAREMNLSRSAVSKYVSHLENDLGTQLLNRTTRQVKATETGAAFYDRCVTILSDLRDAELSVTNLQENPMGNLKINAPMSFGTLHLSGAVVDFMEKYPDINVQAVLNDRFVDPVQEGYDVTIRIADLPDSSLIAKKLTPANRVLCASPQYIANSDQLRHPKDLRNHPCLHYGYLATGNVWRFQSDSKDISVQINGILCSNNAEILHNGVLRGMGIALLPTFIVGPDLQSGRLVPLLQEFELSALGIYALYPPNRQLSTKVRLFIDFLAERFGNTPSWDCVS